MKNKLRDLLDNIYELEGLLHLSIDREERSDDLIRLISKKGEEIAEKCKSLSVNKLQDNNRPNIKEEDSCFDEYSLDEDINKYEEPSQLEHQEFQKKTPQRGKLVFSINEKYRFKQELFHNSDIDFNNTLVLLASMENYDEAEEFFINEEGFELSNPVVREFLEIIKRYFK